MSSSMVVCVFLIPLVACIVAVARLHFRAEPRGSDRTLPIVLLSTILAGAMFYVFSIGINRNGFEDVYTDYIGSSLVIGFWLLHVVFFVGLLVGVLGKPRWKRFVGAILLGVCVWNLVMGACVFPSMREMALKDSKVCTLEDKAARQREASRF